MVADPPAEATKALGLDIDLSVAGLGVRSKRFAIIVDNGIIVDIAVVAAGQTVSMPNPCWEGFDSMSQSTSRARNRGIFY